MGIGPNPDGGGGGGGKYPQLVFSPSPLNFGNVYTGQQGSILCTAQNVGNVGLKLVSLTLPAGYTSDFVANTLVSVGGQYQFHVFFNPTQVKTYTGNLTLNSNDPNTPYVTSVTGTGVTPPALALQISPSVISFPTTKINTVSTPQVFTVKNIGNGTVTITSLTFGTAEFTVSAHGGLVLAVGQSTTVSVEFTPDTPGQLTDRLSVASNAPTVSAGVNGQCVLLFPIAICFQNQRAIVFVSATGVVETLTAGDNNPFPLNINTDQPTTLVFDDEMWDAPGMEKQLMRIEVFFEAGGQFQLTATVNTWRAALTSYDTQTVTKVFNPAAVLDSKTFSDFIDIEATGEMLEVIITGGQSTGPASIVGFIFHFIDRGEKVEAS